MEFVSARDLRLNPKAVWRRIESRSVGVVTINGKPSFLLTRLEPGELEQMLYLQNRVRAELALQRMRDQAVSRGLDRYSSRDIEGVIRKARKSRPR